MGFQSKRKTFKLIFSDPESEGLEVKAKSPTMDDFLTLQGMAGVEVSMPKFAELIEIFGKSLTGWNVEDEGVPVPATVEGARTLEPEFLLEIMDAWMDAVNGVDVPLEQPSEDGGPSLVASIPMEALSESQAS
jgi:hypothetical protein